MTDTSAVAVEIEQGRADLSREIILDFADDARDSATVQCFAECEIKTALLYTPEFFAALLKIIDKRPQRCKSSRIADGDRGFNKDGTRKKFPAVVRLCVVDLAVAPNIVSNIAMFCTRCKKPGQEWRTPRRIKPQHLPQLWLGQEESNKK